VVRTHPPERYERGKLYSTKQQLNMMTAAAALWYTQAKVQQAVCLTPSADAQPAGVAQTIHMNIYTHHGSIVYTHELVIVTPYNIRLQH
jgi:hypothetical protein